MPRKRYTTEQIIGKLREAEVLQSQGATVAQISKQLEINNQTYYRWRKEYGGILIEKVLGRRPFTWGGKSLTEISELRTKYIDALREADEGNFSKLLKFARI